MEKTKTEKKKDKFYEEFNLFQRHFYTNKNAFQDTDNFDFKRFGYMLLNSYGKGFPIMANILINLKGIGWDGVTSTELLKAHQMKIMQINASSQKYTPRFIYYKNRKPEKEKKERKAKVVKGKGDEKLYEFDAMTKAQICEIMKFDSKTYEVMKFTEKVQFLGKQIIGEMVMKEKTKKKK